MLATGTLIADADLHGAPGAIAFGKLTAGTRLTVTYDTGNGPGEWELVTAGPRAGWVQPNLVKRDPMLILDAAHQDYGPKPDWLLALETPGFSVIGLKATQGTDYAFAGWHQINKPRVMLAAGDRLGVTAFMIAYHYFVVGLDPIKQGDYFLKIAGTPSAGHVMPFVDIESADNADADRQRVIDDVAAFIAHVTAETGGRVGVYGGSYLRDRKIKGSDLVPATSKAPPIWVAEYGPELKPETYHDLGYSYDDVFAWQYAGDQPSTTPTTPKFGKLPHGVPALGHAGDSSIILKPKTFEELRAYRWGCP